MLFLMTGALLALQSGASASQPLSLTDILGLAAVAPMKNSITQAVGSRGISFSPTANNLELLLGTRAEWAAPLVKNAKVFPPATTAPTKREARHLADLARCGSLIHSNQTPSALLEAERTCKAALAVTPQNPFVMLAVGASLARDFNKRAEAAAFFRNALAIEPELPIAHVLLADALMTGHRSASDYDEGVLEIVRALRLEPNEPFAMFGLVIVFGDSGVPDHAITALRMESARNPNDAVAHFVLGIAYQYANQHQAAIAELREAIRLDSTNAEYHDYLGGILSDLRDLDGALTEFESAKKLAPDNERFSRSYEEIAARLKQSQEASKGSRP